MLKNSPTHAKQHYRAALALRWLVFMTITLSSSLFAQSSNLSDRTDIKFWIGGMSPALREYQSDLIISVLDKTLSDYPPYSINFNRRIMSAQRSKLETERGTNIHAHFSTGWVGSFVNQENVFLLDYPYLKERLGLRKCIALKEFLPRFGKVRHIDDFKKLRIGQQRGWSDSKVYSHHNTTVIESVDYSSLFDMLEHDRYDCFPLSVLEIEKAMEEQLGKYPNLVIVPDLYIFYPIPLYLSVSKNQPLLAKRLTAGSERILADGSLNTLFDRHFKYSDNALNQASSRIFILDNPLISREQNQAVITRFKSNLK